MSNPSKRRQDELRPDEPIVMWLYESACKEFGKEAVNRDLTRLWDLRCIWGMKNKLPFGMTNFHTLSEMWWIAKEVCKL